jgi:hypothetical protein
VRYSDSLRDMISTNFLEGLKGSLLYWSSAADFSFYQNTFNFGGGCYTSETISSRSLRDNYTHTAAVGSMSPILHDSPHVVYSRWEKAVQPVMQTNEPIAAVHTPVLPPRRRETTSALKKRASIPYLPGNLLCPAASADLDTLSDGLGALAWPVIVPSC